MNQCNAPSLVVIIHVTKNILFFIQMIVPILLIIWGSISFIKMVKNPEEKKRFKKSV